MSNAPATLSVWVGDAVVCIKIAGRASFQSSVDFKSLILGLRQQGRRHFVLDLTDCQLMDSTFLGVLAGLGLRFSQENDSAGPACISLFNPSSRIFDLIENLGIDHLFQVLTRPPPAEGALEPVAPASAPVDRKEISRTCLEAHQLLMAINPANIPKFKDVTRFLEEDLKKSQ